MLVAIGGHKNPSKHQKWVYAIFVVNKQQTFSAS
jgi:hypothetical protein